MYCTLYMSPPPLVLVRKIRIRFTMPAGVIPCWRSATEITVLNPLSSDGSSVSIAGYCGEEVVELAVESASLFGAVQAHARENPARAPTAELVSYSARYRKILHKCGTAVLRRADGLRAAGMEADLDVENVLATVDLLGKVWHLCEIFLLDPEVLPSESLVQFLRESFGEERDQQLREREAWLQMAQERPELGQWYTDLLKGLLVTGEMDRAASLLRAHSEYIEGGSSNPPYTLCELIRSRPVARGPLRHFSSDWSRWRQRCSESLFLLRGDGGLSEACQLLLGDAGVLEAASSSWSELLCAQLLFSCPTVSRGEVRALADACRQTMPRSADESQLVMEQVILRMMSEEAGEAFKVFALAGSDVTATGALAHLVDLLYKSDVLQDDMVPAAVGGVRGLRERLLLDLSEKLFVIPRGWELVARYLSECPTTGKAALQLLLQRISPQSEKECEAYVGWCVRAGLEEEALVACRVRARYWADKGSPGTAAHWLCQCGDGRMLGRICANTSSDMITLVGRALRLGSSSSSSSVDTSVGDALGDAVGRAEAVLSAIPSKEALKMTPELEFLQQYKELVDIISLSPMGFTPEVCCQISHLLETLLACGIAPSRVWPHLLQLALYVIRAHDVSSGLVLFDDRQVMTLLDCLHQLESSHCKFLRGEDEWVQDLVRSLSSSVQRALLYRNKMAAAAADSGTISANAANTASTTTSTKKDQPSLTLPSARSLLYGTW
jgi:hypothetical protein